MKKLKILLLTITCFLLGFSCNTQKKQNKDAFQFEGEMKQTDIEITKSFIYLFPSPGELLEHFYEANLTFNSDLLHASDASDKYLTSKEKGLNLGVYLTDMAYASLFSRSSEAVAYLDVVRGLSEDLNVASTAFESLIVRAQNNLGLRDSLVSISNEVFFNMVEFMESSGMENTIAIISCGAYVEAMYLALNSVDAFREDDPIISQIAELKFPMENLLSQAESVSDDPNVQSILKYITELNGLFMELESKSSKADKSAPGVITLTGGSAPELTEENFDVMKSSVQRVRNYIIGH